MGSEFITQQGAFCTKFNKRGFKITFYNLYIVCSKKSPLKYLFVSIILQKSQFAFIEVSAKMKGNGAVIQFFNFNIQLNK